MREQNGAITFEVRVVPRASRNCIVGIRDGVLRVALTAPPVDGAANEALKKLLAKALRISRADIEILHGDHARLKVIRVRGLHVEDVRFGEV